MLEDLAVLDQPLAKNGVRNFLNCRLPIDGEAGGGRGRLAEDHKDRSIRMLP